MRLSLLARKLSVKPSVIIEELLTEGEKPLHGNSKLTDDQIEEIVRLFGPLPEEIEVPEEQTSLEDSAEEAESEPSIIVSDGDVEPEITEDVSDTTLEVVDKISESEPSSDDPFLTVPSEASSEEENTQKITLAEETRDSSEIGIASSESNDDTEVEEQQVEVRTEVETSVEETPDLEGETPVVHEEASTNGHASEIEDATEENSEKREVLVSDLLEDPDEDLLENSDVLIKAPKVHLPGLTVKGKIELPEPKPKPEKETTEKEEDSENHRDRRGRHRGKRRKQSNPVAAARMREERQAERRKKAEQAQEKERKRKHYQQNIQSKSTPPPKKKTNKKPGEVEIGTPKTAPEKNLNALQRFWKWMNT